MRRRIALPPKSPESRYRRRRISILSEGEWGGLFEQRIFDVTAREVISILPLNEMSLAVVAGLTNTIQLQPNVQ